MKLKSLLIVFCLLNLQSVAQLNNLWREGADIAPYDNKRVYEMPNGNLLVARMDQYNGIGDGDDLVLCYSPSGELLWTFGDITGQNLTSSNYEDIDFDSNSNVYLSGTNFPLNALYPKSEITKLSADGELIWVTDFTQQSDWSEEVFQIEVTQDDRIFAIATLYFDSVGTLAPYFIEIDANGDVVTMVVDTEYLIGNSELIDVNDGFLYAVEAGFVTKFDYDGEVVWTTILDFGPDYQSGFAYEGAEYLVKFSDGKFYLAVGLYDINTSIRYLGMAVVSDMGTLEQAHFYSILPDMPELFMTNPLFLELDSENNMYVAGTFFYGEGGIVRSMMESGENRGGKGGTTYDGTFVLKINTQFEQAWISTYLENDTDGVHYPWGTCMNNDQMIVVYNKGNFDTNLQKVVSYTLDAGNEAWVHLETNTDEFDRSIVGGSLLSSTGDLYTCGSGYSVVDFENVSGLYLYKYAFSNVGLTEVDASKQSSVWPNPAHDVLHISNVESGSVLTIYNGVGQLCYRERLASSQTQIFTDSWPAGVYYLHVIGATVETTTVVKQ